MRVSKSRNLVCLARIPRNEIKKKEQLCGGNHLYLNYNYYLMRFRASISSSTIIASFFSLKLLPSIKKYFQLCVLAQQIRNILERVSCFF